MTFVRSSARFAGDLRPGEWMPWVWGEGRERTATLCCPRCRRPLTISPRVHRIAPDGRVSPSWVCTHAGCTYHASIRLGGVDVSRWRGHAVEEGSASWVYADTLQAVPDNPDRDCGHCGLANTPEGHDGCLGTLPGVENACCGHGDQRDAYVVFEGGHRLHGGAAVAAFAKMRRRRAIP